MNRSSEVSLGRFLRIVLVLTTVGITYVVLDSLSGVLLPFAVAWLIAYLLYPVVRFFQYRLRFKYRMPAIMATMLVALFAVAGVLMLIVPSVAGELAVFKNSLLAFLSHKIQNPGVSPVVVEYIREYADEQGLVQLLQSSGVQDVAEQLWRQAQTVLLGTFNVVVQIFASCIILLYVFFILLDYERLAEEWKSLLPVKWRGFATRLSDDLTDGMSQYFRGQAIVALCVGVLFSIGFVIIDFPVAIGFGLFIGVLNLVPYLQVVSLLPMVLLAIVKAANTGSNFWVILFGALVVLCIVQIIQDLILVPRIMGKRMNLHPAVILLSLSVWGKLLGILGMIVALPLTTLLIGYAKRYHELNGRDADDTVVSDEPPSVHNTEIK